MTLRPLPIIGVTASLALWLATIGCSGSGDDNAGGGAAGGTSTTTSGSGAGGGNGGSGGASSCEPFGHFAAPVNTFTLPAGASIYYPDVQAAFPAVDWATLDRLYIPAGAYTQVELSNLPEREASRPLVITNTGGQVKVGPALGANFIWSMNGGSNWVLTGRYDPDAQTGDVGFQGHRCGAYATARDHYGFLSDDALDTTGAYLHMGIAIGSATDFELEYIEVKRSGFAGIRMLNRALPADPGRAMANVRLHDTYVHDTAGEGIYLGWTGAPPSNLLPGLQIYNNRFVRTGNEALQVQQLGEGSHIHHNVVANAALHWRDNGLGAYQDNNAQVQMRSGNILVERNVFVGSAALLLSNFAGQEAGDGDIHVTFRDNYFADNRNGQAGYLGGAAPASSSYRFEHNSFRGLDFSYTAVDPGATDPKILFGINPGVTAAVSFLDNTWDGDEALSYPVPGPNGQNGSVTASGNAVATLAPVAFRAALDVPATSLEFWVAATTLAPGSPPRTYQPGEVVLYQDGELYRCTAASTGEPPPSTPGSWEHLPPPVDDLRVVAGSAYDGYGVY